MPAKKRHATLRKDGRWQCKVQGKTFIDKDKNEAIRKADEYDAQLKLKIHNSTKPKTVRIYAGEWLPAYKSGVSDRCYNAYANHMDRMVSVLGDKTMAEVSAEDAMSVWSLYQGKSASSVKIAAQLFRSFFDAAIDNDYCTKNPFRAKTVTPPKAAAGSHRVLTREEIDLIRTVEHRMRPAAMVMLYAGLRRGEVLALTDEDIDMDHMVIHVRQAVRYDSNEPLLADPKTAAGTRDVPILSPLVPVLKDLKGLVAPSASGEIMTEQAFTRAWEAYMDALSRSVNEGIQRRWWGRTKAHRALLDAGETLPPYREISIRPHDLRHTYCTMLCDAGIPMRQAMEWLGHADQQMILRIYDHNTEARRAAATAAVEAHLKPKPPKRVSKRVSNKKRAAASA